MTTSSRVNSLRSGPVSEIDARHEREPALDSANGVKRPHAPPHAERTLRAPAQHRSDGAQHVESIDRVHEHFKRGVVVEHRDQLKIHIHHPVNFLRVPTAFGELEGRALSRPRWAWP